MSDRKARLYELPLSDNHADDIRAVHMQRGNDGRVSLTIPSRSIAHLERYWRRRCATDIWELGIFPDQKEISEAEAMRHACAKRLRMHEGNPNSLAIVVGDGRTPRLGALLAFTTAWSVISIDPMCETKYPTIKRLTVIQEKVENIELLAPPVADISRIVLLAPHSHAVLEDALALTRRSFVSNDSPRVDAVAMACCVRQTLDEREHCDQRYEDLGCWSARNIVQIWRGLNKGEERTDEC